MGRTARIVPVFALLVLMAGCATTRVTDHHSYRSPTSVTDIEPEATPSLEGVITQKDVLAAIFTAHPDLRALALEREALEGAARQASVWPNPSLGVEVENLAGTGEFAGTDAAETTVGISQEIPLAGKTGKRSTVARLEASLADWERRERVRALRGEARVGFVRVMMAQRRVALARENEQLVERLVNGVVQRVETGDVSPVERAKARVEAGAARLERRRAEGELAAARTALASLWGAASARFERVADAGDGLVALPELPVLASALERHPRVARWEAVEELQKAKLHLAEAEAWPDVEAGVGVRRFNDVDETAFLVEVGVPLPFFDRNQGGIAAAQASLAKVAAARESTRRELESSLRGHYTVLRAHLDAVALLEKELLPAAHDTYESVQRAYDAGEAGLLELLDAERSLLEVRRGLQEAQVEAEMARAELDALLGTPMDESTEDSEGE